MAASSLTQAEADALLATEKHRLDDVQYDYPGLGGSISVPLASPDRREYFLLDVSRGRIELSKGTYQTRARSVVILARLDFGGPPHRNPDDTEIPCPHIHLYREGFHDRWAYALPPGVFTDISDLWLSLTEFMRYCNVTQPPNIVRGLFA